MLQPLKIYQSLLDAKGRKEHGLFLLEGPKTISDLLEDGYPFQEVFVDETQAEALKKQYPVIFLHSALRFLESKSIVKLSDTVTSQGIIAVASLPVPANFTHGTVLAFNGIQDPGNAGTLVRTAIAMGITQILFDEKSADPFSPKTLRSSSGNILKAKIQRTDNLESQLQSLKAKGFTLCALEASASQSIDEIKLPEPRVLIAGSEGRGIDPKITEMADVHVRINIQDVESLNVTIAAAIALYELAGKKK